MNFESRTQDNKSTILLSLKLEKHAEELNREVKGINCRGYSRGLIKGGGAVSGYFARNPIKILNLLLDVPRYIPTS